MTISVTNEVFIRLSEWLDQESSDKLLYTRPLRLNWTKSGPDYDLDIFKKIAARLAEQPDFWSKVIQDRNWRSKLVGTTCLLLKNEKGFFSELNTSFLEGGMVVPHIAVTLGLLHPENAKIFFSSFVEAAGPYSRKQPVQLVSAQRVLQLLGVISESEVSLKGWDSSNTEMQAKITNIYTLELWQFWNPYLEKMRNQN